jgi:hypothetical protein
VLPPDGSNYPHGHPLRWSQLNAIA